MDFCQVHVSESERVPIRVIYTCQMAQGAHSSTHILIQRAEISRYLSKPREAEWYKITALEQNFNAIKRLAITAFPIIIQSFHNCALQNVAVMSSTERLAHF
jgi:hypothetical protein